MKRPRLAWPTLPARFTADVLAGHSAVALALGALIYLVCLTGVMCVFIDELQLWEAPAPRPAVFQPQASDQLVAAALAQAGGPAKVGVVFLRAPVTPRQRAVVSIGEREWAPGPHGRLVALHRPFTTFLEALHFTLTLPTPWGGAVVGLLGMALASLLASGVLAHPRILRDAFVLRLGGASARLREADIHNRLGVWGLPFHLAVSLTGALFGLASLVMFAAGALAPPGAATRASGAFLGPTLAADPSPAPLPPLSEAIRQSLALTPGSRLYYLSVAAPGTRGAKVTVEALTPDRLPRGEDSHFDARGRLIGRTRFASGDLGLQLYSAAAQVHFGFFGGLPVRLAYGLLGWALTWVSAGGTSIWLARRRDRGRPAPRLEAAWSAWVWGAPAALALAAMPAPFFSPAAVFWIALAALTAFSQLRFVWAEPRRAEGLYRRFLAALLMGLAGARLPAALQSATALVIEAGLLLAAMGLAAASSARRRVADASVSRAA